MENDESNYMPTPETYAEDFAPAPPKPISPLAYWPTAQDFKPVLVLFMLCLSFSTLTWQGLASQAFSASGESVFTKHEYYRLLTALFAHADLGHLLSNTPLMLIFGWFLAGYFGWLVFPIAALLIGVLSNLLTIYIYAPQTELLGASGMLYGMISLWLVLYVRFETVYKPSMRIFRALGVALVLLFPTTFVPSTSYLAHATGFFLGLILGLLGAPHLRLKSQTETPGSFI